LIKKLKKIKIRACPKWLFSYKVGPQIKIFNFSCSLLKNGTLDYSTLFVKGKTGP